MNCKYCHKPAGLFRIAHKECAEKHKVAIDDIKSLVTNCMNSSEASYEKISDQIDIICSNGFINSKERNKILVSILKNKFSILSQKSAPFCERFVRGFPELVRHEIYYDWKYIRYWNSNVKDYLTGLCLSDNIDSNYSEMILHLIDVHSWFKYRMLSAASSGLDQKVNYVLQDGIIDQQY